MMARTEEVNQMLNEQAGKRNHIGQYEAPDGKDTQTMISWYLISRDLDEMISCMDLAYMLGKTPNISLLVVPALWEKMIIAYGKIFGGSQDGYSTLQRDKMVDKIDLPLHDQLIAARNSYVAHRGENNFENHKLILSLEGTEDNCHIQFIVPWSKPFGQYGDPVILRRYLKRIRKKVLKQLAYMKESYEKKIFEDLGLKPNLA